MRTTHALVQVALAIMEDPTGEHYGYELSNAAGVRSGVLYPILTRMLDQEWVTDGWEDPAKIIGRKRPPRRYYKLTGAGQAALTALIANARTDTRFRSSIFGRPQQGMA